MSKKNTDPASDNISHDESGRSLAKTPRRQSKQKPKQAEKDTDRIERAIAEYERIPETKFAESAFNFGKAAALLADSYGKDIRLNDLNLEWQDWLSLKSCTPLEFVLLLCEVSPIRVSKNESDSDIIKNLPDYMAMLYEKPRRKDLLRHTNGNASPRNSASIYQNHSRTFRKTSAVL